MTKHTQGPWEINSGTTVYAQNGMIQVALCKTNISSPEGDTLEKARANAHLIAAAPDLLEACEFFSRACKEGNPMTFVTDIGKAVIMVDAAISKAKAELENARKG